MSRPEATEQLGLFPAATGKPPRRPVTRQHLILARRVVRMARARGPLLVTEVAAALGAELGDTWLAAGIAQQWRKVDVCDGFVVPVAPRGEAPA